MEFKYKGYIVWITVPRGVPPQKYGDIHTYHYSVAHTHKIHGTGTLAKEGYIRAYNIKEAKEKFMGKFAQEFKTMYYKPKMVTCMHCKSKFDSHVDVSPDQPEIAYGDPVSHGLCPNCLKPWYE